MITAVHTLVYAEDAVAARAFFRDVLGWPHVDAHGGWLIFKTGSSELGVHPTSGDSGEKGGRRNSTTRSLSCATTSPGRWQSSRQRGQPPREIRDDGYGMTTTLVVPGAGEMVLYEPKHPTAYDL